MSRINTLLLACVTLTWAMSLCAEDAQPQSPLRRTENKGSNDVPPLSETEASEDFLSLFQETAKPEKSDKRTPKEPARRPTPPATSTPPKTVPPPQPAPFNAPPPVADQLRPFANNPQPAANTPRYIGRLARTPDMFGDSFIPTHAQFGKLNMDNANGRTVTTADLPAAGGSGRFKNEYARALPTDRVFGFYHYFDNALNTQGTNPGSSTNKSVNRFTLGIEKTFFDGNDSVEIRMPFTSQVSLATPGLSYNSEGIGDLVVGLKHLLFLDENQGLAIGLAVSVPTGSNLRVQQPTGINGLTPTTIDLNNQAVYLLPYLAYQATPDDSWFFNGYLQVDTPTNGNSVRIVGGNNNETLRVTDQTLLYLDTAVGYWWWRNDDAELLTGLASIFEVHYTTTLNSASFVTSRDQTISFGNSANRFNVVNVTMGLNASLARNTQLRAAFVLPLRNGTNRFFDSEFTVGVTYRL